MSNTIYVYTDRKQCSYSTTVHSFLHRVGVKSESGSESRSNKDELGKVSREKYFFFLHRVGVKSESGSESRSNKEGFREGFKNFFSTMGCLSNNILILYNEMKICPPPKRK